MRYLLQTPARPLLAFLALSLAATQLPAQSSSRDLRPTSEMREGVRRLVEYLEEQHYKHDPVKNIEPDAFIERFIDAYDTHRLFFHQDEVALYKDRFGGNLHFLLKKGDLFPAFVIFQDYRQRANERLDWVMERLDKPFTFSGEEHYTYDRSEMPWPEDEAAADQLWEKRLKYELLNEILGSTPDVEAAARTDDSGEDEDEPRTLSFLDDVEEFRTAYDEARESVRKRYEQMRRTLDSIDAGEVQEVFLTSLANMYDPHSTFFSTDSLEEFRITMQNSLVGIGAVLSEEEGYCVVKELLPSGPADQSRQIEPGDSIVGVAQGEDGAMKDVIGMPLRKIVKLIRGEEDSTVRLLIRPAEGDPSERREVSIVREKVKLTARLARAEVYEFPTEQGMVPIGVIELPSFYGPSPEGEDNSNASRDVEELIGKLKAMGVKGLVLDLRRNGGGLLTEAVDVTGLFIPVGPVVQVRNTRGYVRELLDRNPRVAWEGPLLVLTSRYSASASEIVAGALKNHNRALVVGDSATHGKGTVQAIYEMDSGGTLLTPGKTVGAAKVTIQQFFLPSGASTQIRGVPSNIALPSFNEYLPIGEDDLENALAWDSIDPSPWDFTKGKAVERLDRVEDGLLSFLRENSLERQQALDEFAYLQRNVAWFRERQERDSISLNLEERRMQRQQDNAFRERMDKELRELASEADYPNEEVLLEVALEQQEEHDRIVEASLKGDPEAETASAETLEDEPPDFDIHLRESLRIMLDWIERSEAEDTAHIAKSDAEKAPDNSSKTR